MSAADTLARVRHIVDHVLGLESHAADVDRLVADLEMDSVDIAQLQVDTEDEFALEEYSLGEAFDEDDITLAEIARRIDACRSGLAA